MTVKNLKQCLLTTKVLTISYSMIDLKFEDCKVFIQDLVAWIHNETTMNLLWIFDETHKTSLLT